MWQGQHGHDIYCVIGLRLHMTLRGMALRGMALRGMALRGVLRTTTDSLCGSRALKRRLAVPACRRDEWRRGERRRGECSSAAPHPPQRTSNTGPCRATHTALCACMHVARTRHVHGAAHVDKLQLANPSPNQLRTSPSGILSAKTRSSMTMEESLGAALARRGACAARGGAKADAPARRSMSRGETIRVAMSCNVRREVRAAPSRKLRAGG